MFLRKILQNNFVAHKMVVPMQSRSFSFSWPCPRKLREIVKESAFVKEDADTCAMIWNEYHHSKNHTVSTVLTNQQYQELMSRGKAAPMFIFPVPKG